MTMVLKRCWSNIFLFITIGAIMASNGMSSEQGVVSISGTYLVVWKVCYDDFVKIDDLTQEEKRLENYDLEIREDGDNYIVLFVPKLLSEDEAKVLNRMVLGREVKYWVDKRSLAIARRVFYKS